MKNILLNTEKMVKTNIFSLTLSKQKYIMKLLKNSGFQYGASIAKEYPFCDFLIAFALQKPQKTFWDNPKPLEKYGGKICRTGQEMYK